MMPNGLLYYHYKRERESVCVCAQGSTWHESHTNPIRDPTKLDRQHHSLWYRGRVLFVPWSTLTGAYRTSLSHCLVRQQRPWSVDHTGRGSPRPDICRSPRRPLGPLALAIHTAPTATDAPPVPPPGRSGDMHRARSGAATAFGLYAAVQYRTPETRGHTAPASAFWRCASV